MENLLVLDNGMGELLRRIVIPYGIGMVAVVAVAWIVWEFAQAILRHMIGNEYSVRVPGSVRVGRNRRHSPDGFSMGYPYWQAAKKDGTRDLRTNNTRIVRTPTVIFLGDGV